MTKFACRNPTAFLCLVIAGVVFTLPPRTFGFEDAKSAQVQRVESPTIEQILRWLPADTETIMHAKGPFQLNAGDPSKARTLEAQLQEFAYLPLARLRGGKYRKQLASEEMAVAVEAARRFRDGNGIGLFPYEGCHILIFSHDLRASGVTLRRDLAADAKKVYKVLDSEVFCFEERPEQELWKYYIVQPKSNILLCATDKGFLDEVLRRMRNPDATRALPERLPLWKHVAKDARFWGVREYKRMTAKDPEIVDLRTPFFLDPKAIGCVFSYDPPKAERIRRQPKLIYVSGSKKIPELVKTKWIAPEGWPWEWRIREKASVLEVSPVLSDDEQTSQYFMMLIAQFGHGFAI